MNILRGKIAIFFHSIDVDALSGVVRAQSGVILEKLDSHLETHGLMAPLDLGAKGSCHIGTVFENHSKCLILIFIFVLLNLTCLVILFDRKLQVFKNSPK